MTVELVVSELVTNAVIHAHSDVELTIRDLGDRIRIEVHDHNRRIPHIVESDLDVHGRGLCLVDALSADWGARRTPEGKTVWCEVRPAPGTVSTDGAQNDC